MKSIKIFSLFLITIMIFSFGSCNKIGNYGKQNIGIILPLTGEVAAYGISSKNGMEIAIDEIDKNSDLFKKLNFIFDDDKGQPKESVNSIKKLISSDYCSVILGGLSSSSALAMAPISEKEKVVLMCAFASSPQLTNAGDFIFRIMPSDAFQASILPGWINQFGYKKIAIVYVKNEWGEALKNDFKNNFLKQGGEIIFEEGVAEGTKDVRNIIVKLNQVKGNIDALFLPTYPEEGGLFMKQLREQNLQFPVFGGDTWANDLIIKTGGDAVENVMFLAPLQYEGSEFINFAEKYKAKFNKEPDLPASAGYDAMKLILQCIKNLIDNGKTINGDNIKSLLYQVKDFRGATGITAFDNNGDVISKEFSKRTIKNGKIINYDK